VDLTENDASVDEEERNKRVDHDAMVALSETAAVVGNRGEERIRGQNEEIIDRRDRHSFGVWKEVVAS